MDTGGVECLYSGGVLALSLAERCDLGNVVCVITKQQLLLPDRAPTRLVYSFHLFPLKRHPLYPQ
jgi:hypothetical protein